MDDSIDIFKKYKINIRKVKKKDLRAVAEIGVNGWKTAYRGIIDDEYLDDLGIEENYQKRLKDYTENGFVVAKLNNEVVGFCRYRTGNYYKYEHPNVDCEISALYVKPEYKGNGIGKNLVNYVIKEFKENGIPYEDDLYLDVVVTPKGDIILLDEDELQEAFEKMEVTKKEYDKAYKDVRKLIDKLKGEKDSLQKVTDKYLKIMLGDD